MGNVDACQNVHADCKQMEACHDALAECKKKQRVCTDRNPGSLLVDGKFTRRSCPSSKVQDAPLTLWSGIRPAGEGREATSGLVSTRSTRSARSTMACTSRSIDCPGPSTDAPALLLPIGARKVGLVRQNTRGTPLAYGQTRMTPANAGITSASAGVTPAAVVKSAGLTPAAVQRGTVRKGTPGISSMQNIGNAGVMPMNYGKTADSLDECALDTGTPSSTPSDAVTQPKVVKEFVKNMMNGIELKARVPGGSMRNVWMFLDDQLSALTVAVEGHKRHILLEQIDDISVGQDEIDRLLSSRVDENFATLFLEDGQGLTFHFDDFEERDKFVKCLSMVIVKQ